MDYNQRLFETSPIRSWYHVSRFNWVANKLKDYAASKRIIELGCFDGRILNHIPRENLQYYHGYDANWEGGLSIAKENNENNNIVFSQCNEAHQLNTNEKFNVFISLETLEHIPELDLKDYLFEIKKLLTPGSLILITVPNELGILFLIKTLLKKILHGDSEGYSFSEMMYQCMGRTSKVTRNQHKGFSWRILQSQLSEIFQCDFKACGVQLNKLPVWCNPSIGLVAYTECSHHVTD